MKLNRRKWSNVYDVPEIVNIRQKIKEELSDKLVFKEDTHQYFLNGDELMCVSNLIDTWSSINEDEMLDNCAVKAQNNKYPNYKYHGMTRDEIANVWKEAANKACEFGSATHAFGESMFYYMIGEDNKILPECIDRFIDGVVVPKTPQEKAIFDFWNDIPECFVPLLAEAKVFCFEDSVKYAGTADILFYYFEAPGSPKNGVVIFDYKTNKTLTNDYVRNNQEMMLPPFSDLFEENLSHYILQLSLYQICINLIDIPVIGRRLIWVKPEGVYEKIKLNSVTDKLKTEFKLI